MFRRPEVDRELLMLGQSEPAVRILASFFTSTGAKSFPVEEISRKLANSLKVSVAKAEGQLAYLLSLDLLADPTDLDRRWIRQVVLSNVPYILILTPRPRLSFIGEQIAKRITALTSQDAI